MRRRYGLVAHFRVRFHVGTVVGVAAGAFVRPRGYTAPPLLLICLLLALPAVALVVRPIVRVAARARI